MTRCLFLSCLIIPISGCHNHWHFHIAAPTDGGTVIEYTELEETDNEDSRETD